MSNVPGTGEHTPQAMSPQEQVADLMNKLATSQAENMALRATAGQLSEELAVTTNALHAAEAEITALTANREASQSDQEAGDEAGASAATKPQSRSARTSLRERLTPRRVAAAATMAGTLAVSIFFGASFVSGEQDQARAGSTTHSGQSQANKSKAKAQTKSNSSKSATTSSKTSSNTKILTKAERDDTVAEQLRDLQADTDSTKTIVRDILSGSDSPRDDHDHDSMSSLRALFQENILSPRQYAEAVALSIKGSDGFTAEAYNALKGNQDSDVLPQGESVSQARQALEDAMTAPGTTFSVEQPGGTFLNHGQRGEDVFQAGIVQLTEGDQSVFVIHTAEGHDLYFKVFDNNCLNILTKINISIPAPVAEQPTGVAPAPAPTPERPHARQRRPRRRHHRGVGTNPHPIVVTQQPQPQPQPQPTPPSTLPHKQIKVAVPLPAGHNHADQSPGTPGPESPTPQTPGPGPEATPPETTTTPPAAPTYPETPTPAPGEPDAPVNVGSTPNGDSTASGPDQGESTQPTSNGGQAGQGGSVSPDSAPVGTSAGSSS